jgi:hypothetical protein
MLHLGPPYRRVWAGCRGGDLTHSAVACGVVKEGHTRKPPRQAQHTPVGIGPIACAAATSQTTTRGDGLGNAQARLAPRRMSGAAVG